MLTVPRYARSLFDTIDDDFHHVLETPLHITRRIPRVSFRDHPTEIAIPTVKGDRFHLNLDFNQFDPSDISVKVEDDTVVVKGKKEKKGDGVYESREFVQRFTVPKNVLADQMTCSLDRAGYLRIEAPVKREELLGDDKNGRVIPVEVVHKSPFKL